MIQVDRDVFRKQERERLDRHYENLNLKEKEFYRQQEEKRRQDEELKNRHQKTQSEQQIKLSKNDLAIKNEIKQYYNQSNHNLKNLISKSPFQTLNHQIRIDDAEKILVRNQSTIDVKSQEELLSKQIRKSEIWGTTKFKMRVDFISRYPLQYRQGKFYMGFLKKDKKLGYQRLSETYSKIYRTRQENITFNRVEIKLEEEYELQFLDGLFFYFEFHGGNGQEELVNWVQKDSKDVLWTLHQIFDSNGKVYYGKFSLPLYSLTQISSKLHNLNKISPSYLNIWVAKTENRKFDEGIVIKEDEFIAHPFHEKLQINEMSLVQKNIPELMRQSLFLINSLDSQQQLVRRLDEKQQIILKNQIVNKLKQKIQHYIEQNKLRKKLDLVGDEAGNTIQQYKKTLDKRIDDKLLKAGKITFNYDVTEYWDIPYIKRKKKWNPQHMYGRENEMKLQKEKLLKEQKEEEKKQEEQAKYEEQIIQKKLEAKPLMIESLSEESGSDLDSQNENNYPYRKPHKGTLVTDGVTGKLHVIDIERQKKNFTSYPVLKIKLNEQDGLKYAYYKDPFTNQIKSVQLDNQGLRTSTAQRSKKTESFKDIQESLSDISRMSAASFQKFKQNQLNDKIVKEVFQKEILIRNEDSQFQENQRDIFNERSFSNLSNSEWGRFERGEIKPSTPSIFKNSQDAQSERSQKSQKQQISMGQQDKKKILEDMKKEILMQELDELENIREGQPKKYDYEALYELMFGRTEQLLPEKNQNKNILDDDLDEELLSDFFQQTENNSQQLQQKVQQRNRGAYFAQQEDVEERSGLEISISSIENIDMMSGRNINIRISVLIDKSLMIIDDRPQIYQSELQGEYDSRKRVLKTSLEYVFEALSPKQLVRQFGRDKLDMIYLFIVLYDARGILGWYYQNVMNESGEYFQRGNFQKNLYYAPFRKANFEGGNRMSHLIMNYQVKEPRSGVSTLANFTGNVVYRERDDQSFLEIRILQFKNIQVFAEKNVWILLEIFQQSSTPQLDRFCDEIQIEDALIPSYLKGLNAICNDTYFWINVDKQELVRQKSGIRFKFYNSKTGAVLGLVSYDLVIDQTINQGIFEAKILGGNIAGGSVQFQIQTISNPEMWNFKFQYGFVLSFKYLSRVIVGQQIQFQFMILKKNQLVNDFFNDPIIFNFDGYYPLINQTADFKDLRLHIPLNTHYLMTLYSLTYKDIYIQMKFQTILESGESLNLGWYVHSLFNENGKLNQGKFQANIYDPPIINDVNFLASQSEALLDYQLSEGEIDINYIRRLRQQIRQDFNSVVVEQEPDPVRGAPKIKKKNFSIHLDRIIQCSQILKFRSAANKFKISEQQFYSGLKINLSVLDKNGYLNDKNSKVCNYEVDIQDIVSESIVILDDTDIYLDIEQIEKVYYENMLDIYIYITIIDKSSDEPILWTNHRVFNDLYELNSGHFISPLKELPIINPADYLQSQKYKSLDSSLKFSFYSHNYEDDDIP